MTNEMNDKQLSGHKSGKQRLLQTLRIIGKELLKLLKFLLQPVVALLKIRWFSLGLACWLTLLLSALFSKDSNPDSMFNQVLLFLLNPLGKAGASCYKALKQTLQTSDYEDVVIFAGTGLICWWLFFIGVELFIFIRKKLKRPSK